MNGALGVVIILGMFLLMQLGYVAACRLDTERALRIYKVAACFPIAVICMVSYRICQDGNGYLLVLVVVILSSASLFVRYVRGRMEADLFYLLWTSSPSSTGAPLSIPGPCAPPRPSLGRSSFARLSDILGKCDHCGTMCNRACMQVACGSCSNTFQFQPACGNAPRLQFACPFCFRTNSIDMKVEPVEPPRWWTECPALGDSKRSMASQEVKMAVQNMMDRTWKNVATRDRDHRIVKFFEVVNVLHNENTALWSNYVRARDAIRRSISSGTEVARIEAKTSAVEPNGLPDCLGDLEPTVNECLLFHGTKPTAADNICKSHFLLHLAGVNKGTLYGPGIYFAENSSKADEYADDDKDGIYQGLYAMLLCRVTCGNMLVTEEVMPDREELKRSCAGPHAKFHSVLGDREKARGTFREFVIFGNDQAYPEYVIIYRRVEEKPTEATSVPRPSALAPAPVPPPPPPSVPSPASAPGDPPPPSVSLAASAAGGGDVAAAGAASEADGQASSAEPAGEDDKPLPSRQRKSEKPRRSIARRPSGTISQAKGSVAGISGAPMESKRSSKLSPPARGRASTASPRDRLSLGGGTKSPSPKGDTKHDDSAGSSKRVSKLEAKGLARHSKGPTPAAQSSRSSRRGETVAGDEQAEALGAKV